MPDKTNIPTSVVMDMFNQINDRMSRHQDQTIDAINKVETRITAIEKDVSETKDKMYNLAIKAEEKHGSLLAKVAGITATVATIFGGGAAWWTKFFLDK